MHNLNLNMKSRIQDLRLNLQRPNKLKPPCNKSSLKLKPLWLKKKQSFNRRSKNSRLLKVQEATRVTLTLKDSNSSSSRLNFKESLKWQSQLIRACKMALAIKVNKCNNSCILELANSRCPLR